MGTAITLGIITSLSFAVLALQAVMVCANWNLVSTSCAYFSWLFSSFHLSGQQLELLVRSLILGSLGPRMRKEFPIDKTALLHGLVGVLAVPFAFVVLGLGLFGQVCSELSKAGFVVMRWRRRGRRRRKVLSYIKLQQ